MALVVYLLILRSQSSNFNLKCNYVNNYKKVECRFINSYTLKWCETRHSKNHLKIAYESSPMNHRVWTAYFKFDIFLHKWPRFIRLIFKFLLKHILWEIASYAPLRQGWRGDMTFFLHVLEKVKINGFEKIKEKNKNNISHVVSYSSMTCFSSKMSKNIS